MIPVILCGGSGTRLWPVSRKTHPKQFWSLATDRSMLQETCTRVESHRHTIVVSNQDHRFFVREQLQELGFEDFAILLEPEGRNTAPAVAVAALQALMWGAEHGEPDPVLLVMPADHVIRDLDGFHRAVGKAVAMAEQGRLATFGIVPAYPETGYGYIQAGQPLGGETSAMEIARFVEKPDLAHAQSYVASGDYYWNSGIFAFRASRFLEELERFEPQMLEQSRRAFDRGQRDGAFVYLQADAFGGCPKNSIDYAVMERTTEGVVIPIDVGWSDVGSWSALWEIGAKDSAGNVIKGDVVAVESEGSYIRAESRLVAVVGVQDLIVVETPDVVLVAPRERAQDVKRAVDALSQDQRKETEIHARVYRPWGNYQGIDQAERYQVKRIVVSPGASLSLQMHHHRAEHWIVVRGTARVTCDDRVFYLTENESTFIPLGKRHRLENPGRIPLELIEVQSGSYLGEDDIVRFDDHYGRVDQDAGEQPE